MNTTLGIGGLLDPASQAGLEKNENDFGSTFGRWGIPKGPYFVIPFLGPPMFVTDSGSIPAAYLSPQNYVGRLEDPIQHLGSIVARCALSPAPDRTRRSIAPTILTCS